jgi:hypothetical protein
MKKFVAFFSAAILFFACNNSPSSPTPDITKARVDSLESRNFFPVGDFILGEIKTIDSFQFPLTKTIIVNKKDNIFSLTTAELQKLANEFLQPDISHPDIKQFYKETSVADQSTASVNLMYNTTNPALEIQRLDVTIKPDPVLSDKVNSIYIEKFSKNGDTGIVKKLIWKAGKNFQIVTEKRLGTKVFPRETLKVVWDPTE